MTDVRCKWDRETSTYRQPDGDECDVPKREHCGAKKGCANHLAWGELTCALCLSRVRRSIARIVEVSPLLITVALETRRIDSEAAVMAGPACDVEAWSWRKVAAMQGVSWHQSQIEDDDDWHPYTILTRWAQMLSEDYGTDRPDAWTIINAAAFLDRILHRVAHDEGQDFRLLKTEIDRCRSRLEGPAVLKVRHVAERGALCPDCKLADPKTAERLKREYPHWCDDEDCTVQVHKANDEDDIWVCPRDRSHWWSHKDYTNRLEERQAGDMTRRPVA